MTKRNTASWFLLAASAVAPGCYSSAHSTASHRDYYAQVTCMDTETCCLQRNPGNPEACGMSASEAAAILAATAAAMGSATEVWDDSHNASLPEWKQRCIRNYGDCQDRGWTGSCYDCLRYCEGQQEWPDDKCHPQRKQR
jgi:hypothetical protein